MKGQKKEDLQLLINRIEAEAWAKGYDEGFTEGRTQGYNAGVKDSPVVATALLGMYDLTPKS